MPRSCSRPRSIPGLLYYLVSLHVRRRPVACAFALCTALALLWVVCLGIPGSADRGGAWGRSGGLQAGVRRDGFVVAYPADAGHRVVELDTKGREQRAFAVRLGDELRAVGARVGTVIAWQEGRKLRLARVDDRRDMGTWGTSVRRVCDGAASNDARFAVGWLEADDAVWIVHGPLTAGDAEAAEATELAVATDALARNEWCGVASAEHNVAMLWRAGDRLSILMCTEKRCGGLAGTVTLDHRLPILGFGCLRNACLIATRDAAGDTRLAHVTASGRVKWTKPLAPSPTVSILGFGDRAFAVGYATGGGAEVLQLDATGAATSLWRDPAHADVPALAWSQGQLLISRHRGDALVTDVIEVAR